MANSAPPTFVVRDDSSKTMPIDGDIDCCLTLMGGGIPTSLRACPVNNRN